MRSYIATLALTGLLLSSCATGGSTEPATPAPGEMTEAATPSSYLDELPPLLDRNLFFDDPEISGAQISPDGQFISFRKPYRDVMNIWVKGVDEPFDDAEPITADTERPVTGYFWSEDSEYVLYVQDKGGDEDFHVYAVDPLAEPEADSGVPPARDLTPYEGIRATILAVPERTPGSILVGMNDRDPSLHDVYRVDLATGDRELLVKNEQNIAGYSADLSGEIRLAVRQAPDGSTEIIDIDDGLLGEVLYECTWEEQCFPIRFHKNAEQVYLVSNHETDLSRLLLMDAESGEVSLVESDPQNEVDFGSPIFSDETEELIGTVYVGDRQRIYPRDQEFERLLSELRSQIPDGELSFSASTEDDRYWVVGVARDIDPGSVFLYDTAEGEVEKLYESRPELPEEHLAPMKAIRYTARDGQEIPAYLTIPKGVKAENLPVIMHPHGGPWARDTWGYDSIAQFLANRGYVVLQMNFRGSTGYGKEFMNAGNLGWGTGIMQHDITDGVQYLVDQGIADPDRVGILGGSYGGYATLAGVTYTPELYSAGVSIVGPSNLITLLNSIPPYWNTFRKLFTLRMGDPDIPEQLEMMKEQSPFFHAEQIEAPLLIIQGAND
ncbi:MAG: prolyl oligopeptidase family serine peptidase, partial [Thermoanaerobaculia bacterium]|nr:prolyl oligopeptidase family serine peptidase [Thermoanaerobaculia bacterium]